MLPAGRRGHLALEASYLIGFTNLISNAGGGAELKNKGFSIRVGYMVPAGH